MNTDLTDRIKSLDDSDRRLLLLYLAERHPDAIREALAKVVDI